ncbi:MAG: S41 family peptidase [Bacteroidota bacterium]
MKKIVLLMLIAVLGIASNAQNTINETQKLATLCKVWGFLKYYHPKVAKGIYDWDVELIKKIPQIKSTKTKEEINKIYVEWIDGLGKVKKRNIKTDTVGLFTNNFDLMWISDTSLFSENVINKLTFIRDNRASKQKYYVKETSTSPSFSKERIYSEMKLPAVEYRLLGLARYWNIVNYYYPYKYLLKNWNNVLPDFVSKFINANDTLTYHLAIMELSAKITDSHTSFSSEYTNNYFGNYYPPIKYRMIDNKIVVFGFWNDSLAKINDIKKGDVIVAYDNIKMKDYIDSYKKYMGASNEPTQLMHIKALLLFNKKDSVCITYERDGNIFKKDIKLYEFSDFKIKKGENQLGYKDLSGDVGYLDLNNLSLKNIDYVMKKMLNKKAIIFDIRNGSHQTLYSIANYLNKDRKQFAQFYVQDFSMPGQFRFQNKAYCGKYSNQGYYRGKVIVLVNEYTICHGEFTCMALQTAPDVKVIGSQTAGTDGNASTIFFPGGNSLIMTGIGVCYPDGRETQRIGIIPDIEVKPTIEGLKLGKDEVLERAIEYINTGK